MKKYKSLLILLLVFHFSGLLSAQEEWNIPDKQRNAMAPFLFGRADVKEGKSIYYKQCASCHGDMGMNNFKKLFPAPNDLANETIAKNTDGELFFKIDQGRSLMPQFSGVLGELEIWKTVAYIRSFHPIYIEETGMITTAEVFDGSVSIETEALYESKRIKLRVWGTKEGPSFPLEGVPIGVYTPRLFGDLLIGEIVETDSYGFAFVDFPAGLPGDAEGMLEIKIRLEDEEVYGVVEKVEVMKAGEPSNPVDILEGRHLWSTRDQAPLWLLLSFFGVIAGIWGTILYIVIKIARIRKISA